MRSTAFLLMFITTISKITGFIREVFFGYFMGTTAIKDIYVTSTKIPSIIFGFIFTAVITSFIPVYNRVLRSEGEEKAHKFTSNLSNILFVIAAVLVLFTFIFARPLTKLFAIGWTGAKLDYAVTFTRIVSVSVFATAFNTPFDGYLNIKDDFTNPAINGIIMNIVLIISCSIAAASHNWIILAFGFVISYFVKYIHYIPALRKKNYKHQFIIDFKDPRIKELILLSLPIIISVAALDLSSIVDQTLASTLAREGAISSLDYAVKTIKLVSGIVVVSIVTTAFPHFAKLAEEGKIRKLKFEFKKSLVSTMLIIIPAVFGLMFLANPIIRLIYQRGAFDATSTLLTGGALKFYAACLIGDATTMLVNRVFYSLGDMKTPVKITFLQVAVDIPLNFVLSSFMGLNGLALSTTIGQLASAGFAIYMLKKKIGKLGFMDAAISFGKMTLASLIMGLVALGVFNSLVSINFHLALFLAILLGAIIYFILILFSQITEVKRIVNHIYHKIVKRNK